MQVCGGILRKLIGGRKSGTFHRSVRKWPKKKRHKLIRNAPRYVISMGVSKGYYNRRGGHWKKNRGGLSPSGSLVVFPRGKPKPASGVGEGGAKKAGVTYRTLLTTSGGDEWLLREEENGEKR